MQGQREDLGGPGKDFRQPPTMGLSVSEDEQIGQSRTETLVMVGGGKNTTKK